MSRDSIRSRIEELESNGVDLSDIAVFGYIDDDGQLVDEHGKPVEAVMFGIQDNHK